MGDILFETSNSLESERKKPLIINGIECIGWVHPQEFPRNSFYTDTDSVTQFLVHQDKSAVSVDSFRSGYILDTIRIGGKSVNALVADSRSIEPEDLRMLKVMEAKQDIFLFGDFQSQFGSHDFAKSQKEEDVTKALGIVGFSALEASIAAGHAKLTRREFIKKGALFFASSLSLNTLGGVALQNKYLREGKSNIDTQRYDNIYAKISEIFNDPELANNVARTGITLAKQRLLAESRMVQALGGKDVQRQISIWGTGHLDTKEDIRLTEKIASDPVPYAKAILEREAVFLIGMGNSMQEVMENVGWLRMCMAGISPTHIKSNDENSAVVFHYGNSQSVFYDKRILGFDPEGMSFQQIQNKSMAIAQASYFALTSNNGRLKILS